MKMKRMTGFLLILAAFLLFSHCTREKVTEDWSKKAHAYQAGNFINGSPLYFEDMLIVGTGDAKVQVFNATTGRLIWTGSLNGGYVSAQPYLDPADRHLYVGASDGYLYAFHISGKIKGFCKLDQPVVQMAGNLGTENPTDVAARFVVFTPKKMLGMALNGFHEITNMDAMKAVENPACKPLWEKDLGYKISGIPIIAKESLYVTTLEGRVLSYRLADGEPLWQVPKIAINAVILTDKPASPDGKEKAEWTLSVSIANNADTGEPFTGMGILRINGQEVADLKDKNADNQPPTFLKPFKVSASGFAEAYRFDPLQMTISSCEFELYPVVEGEKRGEKPMDTISCQHEIVKIN